MGAGRREEGGVRREEGVWSREWGAGQVYGERDGWCRYWCLRLEQGVEWGWSRWSGQGAGGIARNNILGKQHVREGSNAKIAT